jgi:TPP-dependent pyruvate/acetoin dehydrogenase alpha subunit
MDTDHDRLLWMYRTMTTIRGFEMRGFNEVTTRAISAAIHRSVGQEAVPTGICANLRQDDYLASTHRGHGHCIAKGVDVKAMMAELFGRSSGSNRGKGGSMHIADMSKGMLGANGIVGASVPLAVGAGMTAQHRGTDQVAVAFFGDGGSNQGVVHESMNLAAVWKLPVLFVCENNMYAMSTPVEYGVGIPDIAGRAAGYGFPGVVVDGMDVFAVSEAAEAAVARARSGDGPTLLECKTYRYYGHSGMDNPRTYRTEEEERPWRARDPVDQFRERVLDEEGLTPEELETVDQSVAQLMEDAVEFALSSPEPPLSDLYTDVYLDYPVEALKRGASMPF